MINDGLILIGFIIVCSAIVLFILIVEFKKSNKLLPPIGLPKVPAPPPPPRFTQVMITDEWFGGLEKELKSRGINLNGLDISDEDLEFVEYRDPFPFMRASIGKIKRTNVESNNQRIQNLSVEFCLPITKVTYTTGSLVIFSSARCAEGETFDPEKGLMACLAKILVSKSQLRRLMKTATWVEPEVRK